MSRLGTLNDRRSTTLALQFERDLTIPARIGVPQPHTARLAGVRLPAGATPGRFPERLGAAFLLTVGQHSPAMR